MPPDSKGLERDERRAAPLVLHLVHQLGAGLENDLVHLINHMPPERYRHAIVCMKEAGTLAEALRRPGVEVISLHKREGKDWGHYLRLFHVLRRLRPDLIHTRNLAGIEGQLLAAAAGIRLRVHGEHAAATPELHGRGRRYRLLRRLLRPLVGQFVAVSRELEHWLVDSIGARPARVSRIGDGVDSLRFHPRLGPAAAVGPAGFLCEGAFVVGAVGALVDTRDCAGLVRAFLLLLAEEESPRARLRLLIVGDGPCRAACLELLERAGVAELAWLPGARDDVAQLLRAMDLFVQPALVEGGRDAILEAMASGLPVVATAVGGNAELVQPGRTGTLVPPGAPQLLADAIADYYRNPGLTQRHGARARRLVLAEHSLLAMAGAYLAVYDALAARPGAGRRP
jgi:sugar transferase (PEP-CTERM/EpsH1 system associated)